MNRVDLKDLVGMGLGETMELHEKQLHGNRWRRPSVDAVWTASVMRVPNGWLFSRPAGDGSELATVFVPFPNMVERVEGKDYLHLPEKRKEDHPERIPCKLCGEPFDHTLAAVCAPQVKLLDQWRILHGRRRTDWKRE